METRSLHNNQIPRAIFEGNMIREQFNIDIGPESAEQNESVEILKELLHQTWTIFGVSILFNFYLDETHLKQYAKRLREEVAVMLTQEDVTYDAKFFIKENVTRPSPIDPPPLQIEVHAKKIANEETIEKCIYKGIFLSWGTTRNDLTIPNCVRLPLLLCRGTKSCMTSVHTVLSWMFDCMVAALPAVEDDLLWLIPIVIAPTNQGKHPKKTDVIRMEYKVPDFPDTDIIAVQFKIIDLVKILTVYVYKLKSYKYILALMQNMEHYYLIIYCTFTLTFRIMEDQSDASDEISFDLDHIEKFREILYAQMLETSNLQLGLCILNRINLPTVTIMENKMKVMKANTMNRVLSYLNEKALNTFHALNFKF
ncbi:uncharacterized protein LOC143181638 isoform X1 [Calliopsis andreniformis]|uniref:uncharacterized protein LOC143181638 isoform X1 n=1 Tax=Calliopsis andreniformis TaxID=337506 RepID=UPI003FCC3395